MSAADCVFCKVVAGEVPATLVRETGRLVAFRDIAPQAPVHVLVVPREHYADIAALTAADPQLAGELAREAASIAEEEGVAEGWRLVFNTGTDYGQTVFHVHGHVMGGRRQGHPAGSHA